MPPVDLTLFYTPYGQLSYKLANYQPPPRLSTPPRSFIAPLTNKKKLLIAIFKLLLAVAILGYLVARIQTHSGFERLLSEPKNWTLLFIAQCLILVGFSLSFVRWYLLVRGLDLPFHLRDAFRLGSLGYMLNQVSPGSVGGDLLKAVFIAKEQPGKRTEAVATVLVDRAVGLYAMILVASVGLALVGHSADPGAVLLTMQKIIWTAAAVGTAGVAFALSPLATAKRVRKFAWGVPVIGHTLVRLLDAVEVYHNRRRFLIAAFSVALLTHTLVIIAFLCISRGLPVHDLSIIESASVVPAGLAIGTIPLTPGGLGTFEAAFEFLFSTIGEKGEGTIVALTYRAMTYVLTAVGACYYITSRKSVDRMLHDAEKFAEEMEESTESD